jgi:tRNA pseudouridine55 synthase
LHRRARRGESITVQPRPVTFYHLELTNFTPPNRLRLRAVCSAGAYIRSLAHDLGQVLHTYACLSGLRRERVGPFLLDAAHSLAEVEAATRQGEFASLLLPPGYGLEMPRLILDAPTIRRLGYGQQVALPISSEFDEHWKAQGLAQGIDGQGELVGILRCLEPAPPPEEGFIWKAEKWLAA